MTLQQRRQKYREWYARKKETDPEYVQDMNRRKNQSRYKKDPVGTRMAWRESWHRRFARDPDHIRELWRQNYHIRRAREKALNNS